MLLDRPMSVCTIFELYNQRLGKPVANCGKGDPVPS